MSALLWTMEQVLGEAYTPEVHQAWSAACGALTAIMREAAAAEARAA